MTAQLVTREPPPDPGVRRRRGRRPEPLDAGRETNPRLVLRFASTALLTLLVVAVVSSLLSRGFAIQQAIADAIRAAVLTSEVAIQPELTDGLLVGDPSAIAALDDTVLKRVRHGWLVRIKIWDQDGVIRYSDEKRLIGQQFALDTEELEALWDGVPRAEVSDLSAPENRFENEAMAKLLEVYLPIDTPNGTAVLFEAYFSYDGVEEKGQQVWLRFVPLGIGALALLELLQVPIAVALARRLRRSQAQREQMFRRALAATDTERRRIVSDLHDGVVQDLAGVAFSLGALGHGGAGDDRAGIREAAGRVRRSVKQLRSLLVDIYPPELHEMGLEPAVSDLLARVASRGVRTSLRVDAPLRRLSRDRIELIYRVTQEGLRNVVLHAGASRVDLTVTALDGATVLRIVDDGRGFDAAGLTGRPGHLGLRAMTGMAAGLGAVLVVESAPGSGTELRLEVPIG